MDEAVEDGIGERGVDDTLVKALARAFRWRKLLETRIHGTVDEIARAEGITT